MENKSNCSKCFLNPFFLIQQNPVFCWWLETLQRTGVTPRADRFQGKTPPRFEVSFLFFLGGVSSPSFHLPQGAGVVSLSLNPEVASVLMSPSCSAASPLQPCNFIPKLKGEHEGIKLLFPACPRKLFTGVHLSLGQLQGKFFWSFSWIFFIPCSLFFFFIFKWKVSCSKWNSWKFASNVTNLPKIFWEKENKKGFWRGKKIKFW